MDMTTLREKNISRCVWRAKAVAILTVIIAHSDFQNVRPSWLVILFQRIGSMGVPYFSLVRILLQTHKICLVAGTSKEQEIYFCSLDDVGGRLLSVV